MISCIDSFVLSINRQIIIWMIGIMAIMVFSNVVLRYLLNDSILWVEEISRYLMIWATFLGSGMLFRQGAHIAVDTLQDIVPRAVGIAVRILIVAVLMFFFITMIFIGSEYVMFQWSQVTPVTRIPFGFVYAALPVGFLLMAYHTAMIARVWIEERRFDEQADIKIFIE